MVNLFGFVESSANKKAARYCGTALPFVCMSCQRPVGWIGKMLVVLYVESSMFSERDAHDTLIRFLPFH